MKRKLLLPDDIKHYRRLLNLDSAFEPAPLPRGFDYEAHIKKILEMIWSRRMTELFGIDLDRFYKITKVQVAQQKRDLLEIALTAGPIPSSGSFLIAADILLHAESTGHNPIDVRPPALRIRPVRLAAVDGIEVWCGAAAAIPSDIALVLADIDLSYNRVRISTDTSIQAHTLTGPRLRTDSGLIKSYFDEEFQAGSVALTRGYFSRSRYLAHAIPPVIDDGIWKHSLRQLSLCYEGLWELSRRLKANRIAVQFITLGSEPELQKISREVLFEQVKEFRRTHEQSPAICIVADKAALGIRLATEIRAQ